MMSDRQDERLDRREVTRRLLANRGNLLVIGGLGGTAWDITSAGDSALNFPLWGGMGNAAMIGLGLAIAQPDKRVLVITGDGEMLMGLGGLATIGTQQPENLVVVVFDNELYGETGRQATHTADRTDLAAIANGAGIEDSRIVYTMDDVEDLAEAIRSKTGPLFAQVKISDDPGPLVLPPRDGAHLKTRFRQALLGDTL